jgi:hypothetical protein
VETLAFVRMLNQLFRAAGPALPEEGRPLLHFTMFVRSDVLGLLHQRSFKCDPPASPHAPHWRSVAYLCFLSLPVVGFGKSLSAASRGPRLHEESGI